MRGTLLLCMRPPPSSFSLLAPLLSPHVLCFIRNVYSVFDWKVLWASALDKALKKCYVFFFFFFFFFFLSSGCKHDVSSLCKPIDNYLQFCGNLCQSLTIIELRLYQKKKKKKNHTLSPHVQPFVDQYAQYTLSDVCMPAAFFGHLASSMRYRFAISLIRRNGDILPYWPFFFLLGLFFFLQRAELF